MTTIDFSNRAHWNQYDVDALGWGDKWNPVKHPELLVPFSFTTSRGQVLRFGKMHKLAVPIFREFYRRLDAKHPGVLDGDPDEGCYNNRSKTMGGGPSFHARGVATDTDWNDNPMGVHAERHGPHGLPDDTGDIGRPLGLQWGGEWHDFKDWMHNELHLTPEDAIELGRLLEANPTEQEFTMNAAEEKKIRDIVAQEVKDALGANLDDTADAVWRRVLTRGKESGAAGSWLMTAADESSWARRRVDAIMGKLGVKL